METITPEQANLNFQERKKILKEIGLSKTVVLKDFFKRLGEDTRRIADNEAQEYRNRFIAAKKEIDAIHRESLELRSQLKSEYNFIKDWANEDKEFIKTTIESACDKFFESYTTKSKKKIEELEHDWKEHSLWIKNDAYLIRKEFREILKEFQSELKRLGLDKKEKGRH